MVVVTGKDLTVHPAHQSLRKLPSHRSNSNRVSIIPLAKGWRFPPCPISGLCGLHHKIPFYSTRNPRCTLDFFQLALPISVAIREITPPPHPRTPRHATPTGDANTEFPKIHFLSSRFRSLCCAPSCFFFFFFFSPQGQRD